METLPAPSQLYAVVGPQYCLPYETMLEMKENIFTITGKKEVRDTNKNLHFTIANRLFSVPSKIEILDAAGGPVCMLVSKVFTIRNTTYLCPGNSTDTDGHLLRARKLLFTIAPVLEVFLRGNNSDNPDIILSGSIFNYDFKITTRSGTLLAEVGRDLMKLEFTNQTYYVRILPNVDMAMVLALVVLAVTMFVHHEGSDTSAGGVRGHITVKF